LFVHICIAIEDPIVKNAITDDSKNFDNAQNVSLRCSLRRYKTSVTPRNKHVKNRRAAISDDEDDNGLQYELDDIVQNIIDIFLVFEIDGVVYVCKFLI
jgi:hypothetical protein